MAKQVNDKKLEDDMLALETARAEVKSLGKTVDEIQARIVKRFDELKLEEFSVPIEDGRIVQCKRYQNTSIVINETQLKKALGTKMWANITTLSLDKKKLEAFIASEEIDATVVAKCSSSSKGLPFVKITTVKA